jgi:hypothetical protein
LTDLNRNLRCHWHPGCPDWMHPGNTKYDKWKPEETNLTKAWTELFPMDRVPKVLGQPCCGQFALSSERIRSLPLDKYVFWRNWLLKTEFPDNISGRVWECMSPKPLKNEDINGEITDFWQFIFTGKNVHCPVEHVCYCDGYGVCFGGKKEFDKYMDKQREKDRVEKQLESWREKYGNLTEQVKEAKDEKSRTRLLEETGLDFELEGKIKRLKTWCEKRADLAKERGRDAKLRAAEVGRG